MPTLYYINVSAHLLAAMLWLGRLNALAGLIVVLAAVRLARGG